MDSREIDIEQNHQKILKKEKKKKYKGWVKRTKLFQQKVESAFLGFFGYKKPKPQAICSSEVTEKSKSGLKKIQNKKASAKSSRQTQPSLSNLFQKNSKMDDPESVQRENRGNLTRVSSLRVSTRPKLKIARSMRKRGNIRVGGGLEESEKFYHNQTERENEEDEEKEDREVIELCKKRILMGEKCKPLDFSVEVRSSNNGMFSDR